MNTTMKAKNGKASGKHGINMELWQQRPKGRLCRLIRRIWQNEEMTGEWKVRRIIIYTKKGAKHCVEITEASPC